ncbi:MAG: SUMF1/EgtB/PvdO family nonheme iron enzyme [Anaerolineales bacterium]
MNHIFISHSHKDKDYVQRLYRAMRDIGLDAWINDSIDYGSRWPYQIEKRLQECSIFLLVMSSDSKESDWVQNELLTARRLKKPILPLLLEGEVWWHLQNTQFVDVRDGELPPPRFYVNLGKAIARYESSPQNMPGVDEKPKNEAPSVYIEGNANGSTIIIGEGNAVRNALVNPPKTDGGRRGTHRKPHSPPAKPPRTRNATVILLISAAVTILAVLLGWLGFMQQPAYVPAVTLTPAITASNTSTLYPSLTPIPTITIATIINPSSAPAVEVSPAPTLYPLEITPKGAKMVFIPAGTFGMGSNNGREDERPQHQVSLGAFYMDKYETTNALYTTCVDAGGCSAPSENRSYSRPRYYGHSQFDNYPVIYVNWSQARTYCKWRGARLPTEAEWEYAARGADGRVYPWGGSIDISHANYAGSDTAAVGSYSAGISPFGIYDMAGNVSEWVADWYGENYYATLAENAFNPLGPSGGQYRVLRGGAWTSGNDSARSAYRSESEPGRSYDYLGFRCALTP